MLRRNLEALELLPFFFMLETSVGGWQGGWVGNSDGCSDECSGGRVGCVVGGLVP